MKKQKEVAINYQCHATIQIATPYPNLPAQSEINRWGVEVVKLLEIAEAELTIRFVDATEIQKLNHNYREKDHPTNVLSFPFELPVEIPELSAFLGDIIICPTIIEEEAKEQKKSFTNHLTHIFIHGMLHLLGYDHINDDEATIMEDLERIILAKLAINDPYLLPEDRE